jgi:hypothetical protein
MNRVQHRRRQFVMILALLGLIVIGSPAASAGNASARLAPAGASPLIDVAAAPQAAGSVIVSGRNFTPGGDVYVALYDLWGKQDLGTRWLTSSPSVYGPDGSQDPALGFSRGGEIRAEFGPVEAVYGPNGSQDPATGYVPGTSFPNLCGAAVVARAYDRETAAWSNMPDVDAGC